MVIFTELTKQCPYMSGKMEPATSATVNVLSQLQSVVQSTPEQKCAVNNAVTGRCPGILLCLSNGFNELLCV